MKSKHQILVVQTTAILAFFASVALIPLSGVIACMQGLCVTLLLAALWCQMDKRDFTEFKCKFYEKERDATDKQLLEVAKELAMLRERADHWYKPKDKLPLYDGTYLCAFTQSYPTQFQVCEFNPEKKQFHYFDREFEPDYWCYLPFSYICKVRGGKKNNQKAKQQ
jgi:hypothetical protein